MDPAPLRCGYSVVEIVVVLLLLGIIMAITAPKLLDTAKGARVNATLQSMLLVRDAVKLYKAQNGSYPGESGTEEDFKSDLKFFLSGGFPVNQIAPAVGDGSVAVRTSGAPLWVGGRQDWQYDNRTGQFIINTSGYENH